ncbi:MAG: HAMP domain-containing sensor histidine kinase [Hespellia sp.]|nr:HAMP domain-containing sensor histidine kinase [Hespellia sp.]
MRFGDRKYSYERLNRMIDDAMTGEFKEGDYTEEELSKLEVKWMRFLKASSLSRENIEKDKRVMQELVSDISHQTKTPLANMKLYSELLMEQELDRESSMLAERIYEQSNRLEFLIQSLVKMSRLETGTIQVETTSAPVKALLHDVLLLAESKAAHRKTGIVIEYDGEDCARYDKKWTVEAIYNILDNAVKYSPENSQITIWVTVYEMFVRVSVMDQGIGISEAEMAQIFTRFYRSPRVQQAEGVGVGLYLSREIISKGGGYIKVDSTEGVGSIFHVYLARKSDPA